MVKGSKWLEIEELKRERNKKRFLIKGKKNQRCRQIVHLWDWERGVAFHSLFLSRIYFVDTAKSITKFPKTLGPPSSVLESRHKQLLMKKRETKFLKKFI